MWPHANALANRIKAYVDDTESMEAEALKAKYYTTGRQVRAPRFSQNFSTANIAAAGSMRKSLSRSPSPHKRSTLAAAGADIASPKKKKAPPKPKLKYVDARCSANHKMTIRSDNPYEDYENRP